MNNNPNEKQSQSQKVKILKFLQNSGKITALEALKRFGCMRLSVRIKDLRNSGYPIKSEFIRLENGKRVKQYFMESSNG